jgi:hypothetical protein
MKPRDLGLVAATALALVACKDNKQMHAERAATNLRADVPRAREAAQRAVDGFGPKVRELSPLIATSLVGNDAPAIRSALVGFTTPGGPMTLYPTSFVAVTDREGRALARDVPNESDDRMKGLDLKAIFPCVRQALEGRDGTCVGELPAVGDVPSRVVLVGAAPVKNPANEVIGVISAGLTYGAVARMIDSAIRPHVGDAVLWTSLRWNGRILPSGRDRDVPHRWIVPESLVRVVPAADATRVASAGGEHFWPFQQDGRGWGGAVAALAMIPDTQLVLFRSEASQR